MLSRAKSLGARPSCHVERSETSSEASLTSYMQKKYYVYILTNYRNTVLYIGVTNSLSRRTFEHRKGIETAAFTKKYRLYKLIWFQEFQSVREAILCEKRIKGWRRSRKIDLIKEVNPGLRGLLC